MKERMIPYYGVKEAVFPFNMFQEVDPVLGPEMRSTGEVLGMATTPGMAFYKAEEAANASLPLKGTALLSVNQKDKLEVVAIARGLYEIGFKLMATGGTCDLIEGARLPVKRVKKLYEGRPNILDHMTNGKIQLIINSPIGKDSAHDDSYLRKAAIKNKIPYITTMAAAKAAVEGIALAQKMSRSEVRSLQEWHADIK